MRKREEQAIEKRELKEKAFQKIKDLVHRHVFSDPELLRDLSIALRYGSRNQEQQDALFADMVQNNAEFCLKGDPSFPSSPSSAEQECHFFLEMVEHLAHARPVLERTVALYNRAGKPMPIVLKKWAENPGNPPSMKRGPSKTLQHWTDMRNRVIAILIGSANFMQHVRLGPQELRVGRAYSMEEEFRKDHTICRAVLEVLEDLCKKHLDCHPPTYNMIWNACQRYSSLVRPNEEPHSTGGLFSPQGLETIPKSPGIDRTGCDSEEVPEFVPCARP